MAFKIHVTPHHISVVGNFNLMAVWDLRQYLEQNPKHELVLDLSQCQWLNSEALIFLTELQSSGMHVTLLNPPPLYFKVVELLGLETTLQGLVGS